MPRLYRLTRSDFTRMRGFKRLSGSFFSLSFGELPGHGGPGFACVVSTKAEPRASRRNTLKRRCRSAFLKLGAASGIFVFYAKKGASAASSEELGRDMGMLYERARRLA